MTSKPKYMIFAGQDPIDAPSGLFMWKRAFDKFGGGGDAKAALTKEVLEDYDLIHVNITPGNVSYLMGLREALGKGSSTVVMANVDQAIGMWGAFDPYFLKMALEQADFLFSVEEYGANAIGQMMRGEKHIYVIPHPIDVNYIKTLRQPTAEPIAITCQYHRYMKTWSEYWRATYNIRRERPDIRVLLMGVTGWDNTNIGINGLFTEAQGRLPFQTFVQYLARAYLNMSVTLDYTYGRDIVEAAALGIPTVGSDTIAAMRTIWPELACRTEDSFKMEITLQKLLRDTEFATAMSKQGQERAEQYSLKNLYEKLMEKLEMEGWM